MENNKKMADLRYKRDFALKYHAENDLLGIATEIISVAGQSPELTLVDQKLAEWAKEYVHSNGPLANLRKERDAYLSNSENKRLQEKELRSIATSILFTAANKSDKLSETDAELIKWAGKYVHRIPSLAGLRLERDVLLANSQNERLQYKELSSIAKSILSVTEDIPCESFSEEDLKLVNWAKGFSPSPDWT